MRHGPGSLRRAGRCSPVASGGSWQQEREGTEGCPRLARSTATPPHRTPSCCQVTRANPPDACRLMPTIEWAAIYARRSAVPSTAPVCERSSIVCAANSTIGCRLSTTGQELDSGAFFRDVLGR